MADAEAPKRSSSDKDKDGKKGGKKKGEQLSDEIVKKGGKPETQPGDLAGTLQNLFTQTEQQEAPALKPLRRPKLIYENTYRLNPYKPFSNEHVLKILEITLLELLAKMKYKADTSNDVAMKVAEKVRARVLSCRFDRYKIIVLTHFGPLHRQGLHIGMKCLWDPLRDSYVSHTYKNTYIYCNCSVYGIYFE